MCALIREYYDNDQRCSPNSSKFDSSKVSWEAIFDAYDGTAMKDYSQLRQILFVAKLFHKLDVLLSKGHHDTLGKRAIKCRTLCRRIASLRGS